MKSIHNSKDSLKKSNKPGTAQVGAISKAQKEATGLQSVKFSLLQLLDNSISQFATNLGTQWTMIPPEPHTSEDYEKQV